MRGICTALFGAASLWATASTPAAAAPPPLTVVVNSCAPATVTGVIGNYPGGAAGLMRQFLGIPYAAAPTGANRWQPPKPVPCWTGDRAAHFFGMPCSQGSGGTFNSEDCLFLNVFTQPSGTVSRQPVMVFIHGGGLISGSGSFQLNPLNFVREGVVVVTINYRLGAFGFLAHPALDNVAQKRTGNYGILDQQAALKWVKANIGKFGGDPQNITIFGQSAGGLSVIVHLVSPLSTGLFQKAIIESGSFYNAATPLSQAESQAANFAGCGTKACLLGLSRETILANQSSLGQSTRLLKQDGVVLKDTLQNLLMSGRFKKVPTIVGSTHDETRFHIAGNPNLGMGSTCSFTSAVTPGTYHDKLPFTGLPSNLVTQVESAYPAGASALSANIALAQQWTDSQYACRSLRVSRWLAQNGGINYGYEFKDAKAPPYLWPPFKLSDNTVFPYGAYHGGELPYLFRMGSMNACGGAIPTLTAAQKKLSSAMVTYWTTFAKTGNPNPAGSPLRLWPKFQTSGNMLAFNGVSPTALNAAAFDADHKCTSFWDGKIP
jgi:para-nitrobenzyl esterase